MSVSIRSSETDLIKIAGVKDIRDIESHCIVMAPITLSSAKTLFP